MEKIKNSLWYVFSLSIIWTIGSAVVYYYWNWFFYQIFELKNIEFKEALIIYLFFLFAKLKLNENKENEPIMNKAIAYSAFCIILLIIGYALK